MTILQRIELHKQGYTKDEINALAEEERAAAAAPVDPQPDSAAAQEPQQAPAADHAAAQEPQQAPAADHAADPAAAQLLAAINNLTNALTSHNIVTKEQPITQPETATDVFNSILKG